MNKMRLLTLITIVIISGCQVNTQPNTKDIQHHITYFKDQNTNLCFATINSSVPYAEVTSITCVPCDSLKRIKLK